MKKHLWGYLLIIVLDVSHIFSMYMLLNLHWFFYCLKKKRNIFNIIFLIFIKLTFLRCHIALCTLLLFLTFTALRREYCFTDEEVDIKYFAQGHTDCLVVRPVFRV